MITGFDHVVIAVNDIAAGAAAFETLLGARPSLQERDGIALASFATANLDVELMAPVGAGETADRLRASLQTG